MPRICQFYGITITMYFNDHRPSHFHALYPGYEALIGIETLEVLRGRLPQRVTALVLEWASLHRRELRLNWERAGEGKPLLRIEPLD